MTRTTRTTWMGAVAGALVFVAFGALPGAVWGGFAGAVVGRALLGRPIGHAPCDRVALGAGMALGALLTLLAFAASGAWIARRLSASTRRRLPH